MSPSQTPETSQVSRRRFLQFTSVVGAGALISGPADLAFSRTVEQLPDEQREVVIIGSGFGGAITALRLAEKGIASTIIEQGRRWDGELAKGEQRFSKNLYPDGRSTFLSSTTVIPLGPPLPIRKTTGVLQGRRLANKMVLNGAAYGGGSITWGGVMVKPEKKIFEMVFPKELSYESLEKHYDEVSRRLGRAHVPADVLASENYKHMRVTDKQAKKAGLKVEAIATSTDWDIVRQEIADEIPASITVGEAIYGVNSGAKGTLDRTYLKEAEASGLLEVKTLHQVQDIGQNEDGLYTIDTHELNVDGDIIGKRRFLAKKLFLTAGSVSTSSLLVKAKAKGLLPKLNDEVGQGWGNNGNVYALRLGVGESTGKWQGGPPSIGIDALDHPSTPLFIEHPQLPVGLDIFGLMFFGIGITPTRGTFRYDDRSDSVSIDWPKKDLGQEKVNQALLDILDKMNEANGGWTTSLLTYLKKEVKDDICYHPLGGVVLGKACDFYGRVKGYEGLYVNDGSMLPGASGCCNPSMTISAIAERNIEHLLAEGDFS